MQRRHEDTLSAASGGEGFDSATAPGLNLHYSSGSEPVHFGPIAPGLHWPQSQEGGPGRPSSCTIETASSTAATATSP